MKKSFSERKKSLLVLIIVICTLGTVVSVYALSCPKGKTTPCSSSNRQCGKYVDRDGNGKCDNVVIAQPSPKPSPKPSIAPSTQTTSTSQNSSKPASAKASTSSSPGSSPSASPTSSSSPDPQTSGNLGEQNTNSSDGGNGTAQQNSVQKSSVFSLKDIATPVAITTSVFMLIYLTAVGRRLQKAIRMILLMISVGYLGFYLGGCLCPIGAFQNLPMRLAGVLNGQYIYWFVLMFIPIVFVFIAGRIYCGSTCPMGGVQELLFKLGTELKLNNGKPKLENWKWLKYVKYVIMSGLIVFTAITANNIFCSYDPFMALFNLSGTIITLTILSLLLFTSLFVSRLWCRAICPYGALLGIISKISGKYIKRLTPYIEKTGCKKCKLCARHCPVCAIENDVIDNAECINCGICTSKCKFGAIK